MQNLQKGMSLVVSIIVLVVIAVAVLALYYMDNSSDNTVTMTARPTQRPEQKLSQKYSGNGIEFMYPAHLRGQESDEVPPFFASSDTETTLSFVVYDESLDEFVIEDNASGTDIYKYSEAKKNWEVLGDGSMWTEPAMYKNPIGITMWMTGFGDSNAVIQKSYFEASGKVYEFTLSWFIKDENAGFEGDSLIDTNTFTKILDTLTVTAK